MIKIPLLSLVIFLPCLGALFISVCRGQEEAVARNAKNVAIFISLVTFLLSLGLWILFDPNTTGYQFEENHAWMPGLDIRYHVGLDGISIFFVLLSTLLSTVAVIASWETIKERVKEYMIAFLVLETFMVGMFSALDTVLFYIFFEGVLIPMFLIIGIWGGPGRVYAAFKFFLYTLTGSVLMLIGLVVIYFETGTTSIPYLSTYMFSPDLQKWLWLAFFASFAVKIPMWPVHTWLPNAHVEAPTAGSVILAGILLKMGAYGFLRFSLPMFPEASLYFAPLVYALSIVAIIYTSLVALAQQDMKKLIAYSSVAHMGFVTIGIFTFTSSGIEGALIQMLSHGFVSAALFLCVGVVYDRRHSRLISDYGGLVYRMPVYAVVFMLFILASVGLPGTSGFVGEFLVIISAFGVNTWLATLAATGVVLSVVYALWLYRRVMYGKLVHQSLEKIHDLFPREMFIFAPLCILVVWMGVYPSSFLQTLSPSVNKLVQHVIFANSFSQDQTVISVFYDNSK